MRTVYVNLNYCSVSLLRLWYFTASMLACTVRNEADCQCLKACWYSFRKCFLRVSNCCYTLLLRSFNEVQCRENESELKVGGEKAVNHLTAISAGVSLTTTLCTVTLFSCLLKNLEKRPKHI